MIVTILEDAAEDIEAGSRFYETREQGVGAYFVTPLLSDLESLRLYAGIHPLYHGFHRMLSKRFPFAIYYALERDSAYVYGILDMRRDPLWIQTALKGRR